MLAVSRLELNVLWIQGIILIVVLLLWWFSIRVNFVAWLSTSQTCTLPYKVEMLLCYFAVRRHAKRFLFNGRAWATSIVGLFCVLMLLDNKYLLVRLRNLHRTWHVLPCIVDCVCCYETILVPMDNWAIRFLYVELLVMKFLYCNQIFTIHQIATSLSCDICVRSWHAWKAFKLSWGSWTMLWSWVMWRWCQYFGT